MKLFEAIVAANHRATAGDASAGLHPADFADELPVVALTCIDPRLNPLFPEVLGLPKDSFIWLRNAGNIITGPLSSTMRSLALSCAIKGGKEIAIIGHTDCQVGKTSTMKLTDAFRALGVDRANLPENLTEFFGMFASEQGNVIKSVEFVRHSPLIGSKIPVHGLMVDVNTGKLDWVVNGYQGLDTVAAARSVLGKAEQEVDTLRSMAAFKIGEMKFPDTKIGEAATQARDWLVHEIKPVNEPIGAAATPSATPPIAPQPPATPAPPQSPFAPLPPKGLPPVVKVPPIVAAPKPKMPVPPRVRPTFNFPKGK